MISIDTLIKYYFEDEVFVTAHDSMSLRLIGIKAKDIRHAVSNGEIIEQYPEDYPFPSCLILGKDAQGRVIHVCMSDEGSSSRIITAYYPDPNKWSEDLKVRRKN